MKSPFRALALVIGTLAATSAMQVQAHEAGDWIVKAGVHHVSPKSNNGEILNGAATLDVGSSTRPTLSVTYMATRNLGIDLLAAVPFKHDIALSGAINGNVGSTKHLPPTLSLQYHFLPDAQVQPFVGIGINHTRFFSTRATGPLEGSDLHLKNSWGPAVQVGVDFKLSKEWLVSVDARYMRIESDVSLNGQKIGKAKINPWTVGMSVGYRF